MADNQIDWTTNLTTHPSYGAIPQGGVGYEANTVSTITFSDDSTNITGGYTIGTGANLANPVWTTGTTAAGSFRLSPDYNTSAATIEQSGRMSLRGESADLDINGKSMKSWMEKVEERLNILTPNPELEQEWDELRRLGERYRKLEKKCKEKAEVWKKLKAMPRPQTKW